MRRFVAAAAFFALASLAFAGDFAGLKQEKQIVCEGSDFFDYVTVDAASERLYLAHSPKLDVIDLKKGEKIGEIDGVNGAHGTALVPALKRGFATAGKKNKVFVFDLGTLKVIKEVVTGENPDAVLFVSAVNEVWTFNGKSNDVTCLDPDTLAVKATIKLEGKPEFPQENAGKGLVYVNLEDKSAVATIDVKTHACVGTPWPLAPGKGPSGLALDRKNGLTFSVCENELMVVLDVSTGKVVATAPIGKGCDGVAFDPGTGNIFASCGQDAKTTVIHMKDAKTFESAGDLVTIAGARTCTVDEKTHRLYVAGGKKGEKIRVVVFGP